MFEELEVLISAVPFAVSFLIAYILIWSHLEEELRNKQEEEKQ